MVGAGLCSMLYLPTVWAATPFLEPSIYLIQSALLIQAPNQSQLSQQWPAASPYLASCQSVYWHLLRRPAAEGRAWGPATLPRISDFKQKIPVRVGWRVGKPAFGSITYLSSFQSQWLPFCTYLIQDSCPLFRHPNQSHFCYSLAHQVL